MTTTLENKYVEPDLKHIELSKFDIRKEKEEYHKEQLEIEDEETDKFTSLVESIRELGILQPLYVIEKKDKNYEVIDGGRRLRAAKFLKLPSIPAMIFSSDVNETEIRKRALVANIQRKDLTLEEKGEGLVQYYKSGKVDPEHAISYLNTLRQRKIAKDQRESSNVPNVGTFQNSRGQKRPIEYKKQEDPQEYERFLELHKKLGIPRITQYHWLSQVVFIPQEIRKSSEYKSLSASDQRKITASEIRNKPEEQRKRIKDLRVIEEDLENAKEKRKEATIKWNTEQLESKEPIPKTFSLSDVDDEKIDVPIDMFDYYGDINTVIARLWTKLTMGKKDMPRSTDDLQLDHIKPTRKQFQKYAKVIGQEQQAHQYEWLSSLQQLIDDRMKVLQELIHK